MCYVISRQSWKLQSPSDFQQHMNMTSTQQWVNNYRIIVFFSVVLRNLNDDSILPFINEIVVWLLLWWKLQFNRLINERKKKYFNSSPTQNRTPSERGKMEMRWAQQWNREKMYKFFLLSSIEIHQGILLWIVLMFFVV